MLALSILKLKHKGCIFHVFYVLPINSKTKQDQFVKCPYPYVKKIPELGFKFSASLHLSSNTDIFNKTRIVLFMLLYSRNGCNLILLKLSVFLDKGNDAENLKPSSGVFFLYILTLRFPLEDFIAAYPYVLHSEELALGLLIQRKVNGNGTQSLQGPLLYRIFCYCIYFLPMYFRMMSFSARSVTNKVSFH